MLSYVELYDAVWSVDGCICVDSVPLQRKTTTQEAIPEAFQTAHLQDLDIQVEIQAEVLVIRQPNIFIQCWQSSHPVQQVKLQTKILLVCQSNCQVPIKSIWLLDIQVYIQQGIPLSWKLTIQVQIPDPRYQSPDPRQVHNQILSSYVSKRHN